MATLHLVFSHDGKNTDGSAFDAAQFAGVSYSLDGRSYVSVPAAYAPDGVYDVEVDVVLDPGPHEVSVVVKHVDGTESDESNIASFVVEPILRTPSAPFGLVASYSR